MIMQGRLNPTEGTMGEAKINWGAVGVWFGLRPHEIDQLSSKDSYSINQKPDGRTVLWVCQTTVISPRILNVCGDRIIKQNLFYD